MKHTHLVVISYQSHAFLLGFFPARLIFLFLCSLSESSFLVVVIFWFPISNSVGLFHVILWDLAIHRAKCTLCLRCNTSNGQNKHFNATGSSSALPLKIFSTKIQLSLSLNEWMAYISTIAVDIDSPRRTHDSKKHTLNNNTRFA